MSDLKLLDEVLSLYRRENGLTWEEVETRYNITSKAMKRLRSAWKDKEMESLSADLAEYFGST